MVLLEKAVIPKEQVVKVFTEFLKVNPLNRLQKERVVGEMPREWKTLVRNLLDKPDMSCENKDVALNLMVYNSMKVLLEDILFGTQMGYFCSLNVFAAADIGIRVASWDVSTVKIEGAGEPGVKIASPVLRAIRGTETGIKELDRILALESVTDQIQCETRTPDSTMNAVEIGNWNIGAGRFGKQQLHVYALRIEKPPFDALPEKSAELLRAVREFVGREAEAVQ